MKHTACGGSGRYKQIRKSSAYIVVAGARRREYGPEDKITDGELAMLTEEEREKRRSDAFCEFEGRAEEKGLERKHKERLESCWRRGREIGIRIRRIRS